MTEKSAVPARLYKYKRFDPQTLSMLILDQLYFADPTNFNDPLDTRPSISADLDAPGLETILRRLVEQRIHAEMTAAAKSIQYKGPKTIDHIARLSRLRVDSLISEIAYNATNPEYEMDNPQSFLLANYLEEELLKRYEKGIVSLTEKIDCPLMWSHYGDQHRGICIGYSVPTTRPLDLRKVKYGGSRLVAASDVLKMLDGDEHAQERVDNAVLFRKAAPWKYEIEWRLIGARGPQGSLLELEEIVFGVRCDATVAYTVVKALDGRQGTIKFFQMREINGTFGLTKAELDIDEALATWPRRFLTTTEGLESFDASAYLDKSDA